LVGFHGKKPNNFIGIGTFLKTKEVGTHFGGTSIQEKVGLEGRSYWHYRPNWGFSREDGRKNEAI